MNLLRITSILMIGLVFFVHSGFALFLGSIGRAAAFRLAKQANHIPRSAQPIQTIKVPDKNTGQMLRQYDFMNNRGQPISIRQDLPRNYPNAINGQGNQGPHFNAGPTGEKLKQHYNFDFYNRGG